MQGQDRCADSRRNDHAAADLGVPRPRKIKATAILDEPPKTVVPPCHARRVIVVFDAALWIWDARRDDSWTFVTLPVEASEEIRDLTEGLRRGFGSLRVRVSIGGSRWSTSIFPDSKSKAYVLPIKRAVRKAESLETGDTATVTVELVDV
jgi:hypothetical protein